MSEVVVSEGVAVKQYVCFVKRRAGSKFVPYMVSGDSQTLVVKPLRAFLDHDISKWCKAGEEDKVLLKVSWEQFVADVDTRCMNSTLLGMLGWNYPAAARIVESEGVVFILTCHHCFQSIPFSFRQVCDDDDYALRFVETLWSLCGGEIAFEEYDPEKHVAGYQYPVKPKEWFTDGKKL
jgi:hypothetical protein